MERPNFKNVETKNAHDFDLAPTSIAARATSCQTGTPGTAYVNGRIAIVARAGIYQILNNFAQVKP